MLPLRTDLDDNEALRGGTNAQTGRRDYLPHPSAGRIRVPHRNGMRVYASVSPDRPATIGDTSPSTSAVCWPIVGAPLRTVAGVRLKLAVIGVVR